jgi:hypothetical protein
MEKLKLVDQGSSLQPDPENSKNYETDFNN